MNKPFQDLAAPLLPYLFTCRRGVLSSAGWKRPSPFFSMPCAAKANWPHCLLGAESVFLNSEFDSKETLLIIFKLCGHKLWLIRSLWVHENPFNVPPRSAGNFSPSPDSSSAYLRRSSFVSFFGKMWKREKGKQYENTKRKISGIIYVENLNLTM